MLLKRLAFLVIFAAILLGRGARRERLVARLDRTAGSAREAANFFFMKLFRNLARAKARARRSRAAGGTDGSYARALVPVLLGREQLLPLEDGPHGESFTAEQLAFYGGVDPALPLYLAVKGRVYDVRAGKRFYGRGAPYNGFAGRDATRAFCTGCLAADCLVPHVLGLSERLRREADRWVEFFQHHDRYTFVGRLDAEEPVDLDEIVLRAIEVRARGAWCSPSSLTHSRARRPRSAWGFRATARPRSSPPPQRRRIPAASRPRSRSFALVRAR